MSDADDESPLESEGPYAEWTGPDLLMEFARRLRRKPFVLLLRLACEHCKKAVYAVDVRLLATESEAYDQLGYSHGPLAEGTFDGQYAFELSGGAVRELTGLDAALDLYRTENPELPIATFKIRDVYGENLWSQGCPHCDEALVEYEMEGTVEYLSRIADGDIDGKDLIGAFDLSITPSA